ncbi:MAG TPA: nuclear transport factor 2 family protein [Solirubrobacterales bacterium]|nr:nuclear transport factor 2 family protein [Solirubrobacterales bacterium]
MSAEDLASLRQMWEMWGGPIGGPEARAKFRDRWWHPEITYEEDPRWPGSGTYHGKEQVAEVFESYMEVFSGNLTVERLVEGEDRLVAFVRFRLLSAGGDVPTERVWAYVCRARDGQLSYLRAYWDPQEALEAAGVS